MEKTIYAPLEWAQKLQKAGWWADTKAFWVNHCENYEVQKRNGFGVCYGDKVWKLVYGIERVPFRFENAMYYVDAQTLKKLKYGSVFDSMPAPTIGEIKLHESMLVLEQNGKWRIWRKRLSHQDSEYSSMDLSLEPVTTWGKHEEYDNPLFAYIDAWILAKKRLPPCTPS